MMMGDNTEFLDAIDVQMRVGEVTQLDPNLDVTNQIVNAMQDLVHDLTKIAVPQDILQPLLEILQPNRYNSNGGSQTQVEEDSSSGGPSRYINPLTRFRLTKKFMMPGKLRPYFVINFEFLFPHYYRDINIDCGLILIARRLAQQYIREGKDAKALIKSMADKFKDYKFNHGL